MDIKRTSQLDQCSKASDNQTPDFYDERRERLPLLYCKGGKKGAKSRKWMRYLLADRLQSAGVGRTIEKGKDFETFFKEAPRMNPSRTLIKGVVCGVRVEDIQERRCGKYAIWTN